MLHNTKLLALIRKWELQFELENLFENGKGFLSIHGTRTGFLLCEITFSPLNMYKRFIRKLSAKVKPQLYLSVKRKIAFTKQNGIKGYARIRDHGLKRSRN